MITLSPIPTAQEVQKVIDYLKSYIDSRPSGGGIASVTGNIVDNTDPDNPVVTQVQANMAILDDTSPAYVDNVQAILDVDSSIPDENYDESEGFRVGSRIFVEAHVNSEYVCIDNTTGAAIWIPSIGFKRFVGTLNQDGTNEPTISTSIVNDWGIENTDFSYVDAGEYTLSKTGIGVNFPTQFFAIGSIDRLVGYLFVSRVDDGTIRLLTTHTDNTLSDNILLLENLIEIKFPI